MVLLYILSWIVLMGAALTVGVGMGLAQHGPESPTGWMIGIFGAAMLFGLVVFGFYYILQMVTYYDLRVRKEGLDLELASAAIPAA
jgi:TRAP-type C4-dicarboxylate transport system permease small subunit